MTKLKQGLLVVIEGIDGSGKSSLIQNLFKKFEEKNITCITTKEPGGSPLGKELRTILQKQHVPVYPKAEYLLFAADRSQHIEQLIKPALHEKKLILCDRMSDSSVVYQGYGRGLNIEKIKSINAWAMDGITPDITLYVNIDIETAFKRMHKRNEELTAFEKEKKTFFEKLVNGYSQLYKNRKDVITLDGSKTPEEITQKAFDEINSYIKNNDII